MASLDFTERTVGTLTKVYEAETTVNADFNLHVEREAEDSIEVYVTTVKDGGYQLVYSSRAGKVFDHDFDAIVYPKYVKVRSWSKPLDGKNFITEEA